MNPRLLGKEPVRAAKLRHSFRIGDQLQRSRKHIDISQAFCHHQCIFYIFEGLKGGQLRAWCSFNEEHSTGLQGEQREIFHCTPQPTVLINYFITVAVKMSSEPPFTDSGATRAFLLLLACTTKLCYWWFVTQLWKWNLSIDVLQRAHAYANTIAACALHQIKYGDEH